MKLVDEFRDPDKAQALATHIREVLPKVMADRRRTLQIMEFCGGHTHTIFKFGLEELLPEGIELVHGPGCPVCVLPMGRIDDAIAIAHQPNVIFTTFGDAMRVPGSRQSLLQAKADGADIRMVYSPTDALALARQHPEKRVVFFALGFETTMPSTALTVLQAEKEGLGNFSLFCNHITTVPTIKAVLDSPAMQIDGFIAPGHVSMVVGEQPFQFVAGHYNKPIVIAGFEPLDILQALSMLIDQFAESRCEVANQYTRVAPPEGNPAGLAAIHKVFELREFFEWRGLGSIDHSGVKMRPAFAQFDAECIFDVPNVRIADPKSAQCGEVVKGVIKPWECKVFGKACTPQTPVGALMVSSEGACAAYYNYGKHIPRVDALRFDATE
ncbi:MAG: hydrogenase formation protein HypD [Gammaproteobacteria bacterium]|nr:hydrogenase formation protein HypD [Gammaproteobacteria bacterium]MCP5135238.1 hydrogenase formation protein HypD [Gammaproteobacteria bacterium]